jgi:hypothetical protein
LSTVGYLYGPILLSLNLTSLLLISTAERDGSC